MPAAAALGPGRGNGHRFEKLRWPRMTSPGTRRNHGTVFFGRPCRSVSDTGNNSEKCRFGWREWSDDKHGRVARKHSKSERVIENKTHQNTLNFEKHCGPTHRMKKSQCGSGNFCSQAEVVPVRWQTKTCLLRDCSQLPTRHMYCPHSSSCATLRHLCDD